MWCLCILFNRDWILHSKKFLVVHTKFDIMIQSKVDNTAWFSHDFNYVWPGNLHAQILILIFLEHLHPTVCCDLNKNWRNSSKIGGKCKNYCAFIPLLNGTFQNQKKKSNLVNQYKTIANNTLFEVDLKIITNPIKVIFFTCLNDKRRRRFGFLID